MIYLGWCITPYPTNVFFILFQRTYFPFICLYLTHAHISFYLIACFFSGKLPIPIQLTSKLLLASKYFKYWC